MNTTRKAIAAFFLLQIPIGEAMAGGAGTVAGLTLLEAPSARASALGQSLVAGSNDISNLGYNPASLSTLKTGQASFLYQKGLIDDSYGHFMVGSPSRRGGVGLSIGFYNGGEIELSDGASSRSVTAQRDLAVSLGFARNMGRVSLGSTAKYLSSEIAQTARATAFAADLGLSVAAGKSLTLAAALQNVGSKLKYVDQGDDLPRMARLGAAFSFRPAGLTTTMLFDGTYRMIEKEFQPAAGIEVGFGVLSLRAGFRGGSTSELTAGTGFYAGRSSVDYAFGMATGDLSSTHKLSYSLRFGGKASIASQLVSTTPKPGPTQSAGVTPRMSPYKAVPQDQPAKAEKARTPVETTAVRVVRRGPKTHEIRSGETLASIARENYGDPRLWRRIYQANSHILTDPTRVEPGQRIVLP